MKIYFSDPFFYHAAAYFNSYAQPAFDRSREALLEPAVRGALIEGVVANHCIRLAYGYSPSPFFDSANSTFYNRTDGEKETDFIVKGPKGRFLPIEVKNSDSVTTRELEGLLGFVRAHKLGNGLVLGRKRLSTSESYMQIPAAAFLMLV